MPDYFVVDLNERTSDRVDLNSVSEFAFFVKRTRKVLRLQQMHFEGMSQGVVSKIETHKTDCSISIFFKIVKILGYRVELVKIKN